MPRRPDTAPMPWGVQVAWTCPEAVSPHLEHFIGPWCAALRHLQDGIEKEHAFLGLCDVLRLNPQASVPRGSVAPPASVSCGYPFGGLRPEWWLHV